MKKIILIGIVMIILVGCKPDIEVTIGNITVSKETELFTKGENYIEIECNKDSDCNQLRNINMYFEFSYFDGCVNNTCRHDMYIFCESIAISDYNMTNPTCAYQGDNRCGCKDLIPPSKRIIKERSIQIIPEEYGDTIWFDIIKY